MKKTIQEYLSGINERIDFSISETDKILSHFDKSSGSDAQLFSLVILDRLHSASLGLKCLIKEMTKISQLEYSCGIILRSVLLDSMIVFNLHTLISEKLDDSNLDNDINSFCKDVLSECVDYTLDSFDKLKLPKEELSRLYTEFAKSYSNYLEPYSNDGSKPLSKIKKNSPLKMFNNIHNSKYLKDYSDIYQAYLFYSKYDHFGIMYYDFRNHNFEDKLFRMYESIKVFQRVILFTITTLVLINRSDRFLADELEIITTFHQTH